MHRLPATTSTPSPSAPWAGNDDFLHRGRLALRHRVRLLARRRARAASSRRSRLALHPSGRLRRSASLPPTTWMRSRPSRTPARLRRARRRIPTVTVSATSAAPTTTAPACSPSIRATTTATAWATPATLHGRRRRRLRQHGLRQQLPGRSLSVRGGSQHRHGWRWVRRRMRHVPGDCQPESGRQRRRRRRRRLATTARTIPRHPGRRRRRRDRRRSATSARAASA